jgi:hypothetical protein
MFVAIVGDVELDWCARAVAVEHVVDAAVHIDDRGNFNHHQVQLAAEIVLDVALKVENRLLRFSGREQRGIVGGQNLFKFQIVSDAGARPGQLFCRGRQCS